MSQLEIQGPMDPGSWILGSVLSHGVPQGPKGPMGPVAFWTARVPSKHWETAVLRWIGLWTGCHRPGPATQWALGQNTKGTSGMCVFNLYLGEP